MLIKLFIVEKHGNVLKCWYKYMAFALAEKESYSLRSNNEAERVMLSKNKHQILEIPIEQSEVR